MKCEHLHNCHNGEEECESTNGEPKICHMPTEAPASPTPFGLLERLVMSRVFSFKNMLWLAVALGLVAGLSSSFVTGL